MEAALWLRDLSAAVVAVAVCAWTTSFQLTLQAKKRSHEWRCAVPVTERSQFQRLIRMFLHILPIEFNSQPRSIRQMHASVLHERTIFLHIVKPGAMAAVLENQEIGHHGASVHIGGQ